MDLATDIPGKQQIPPVALIVAMTKEYIIGTEQGLPWHRPDDLQLFKRLTTGGTVIMGHKTYLSIGHPLTGRQNIVLSRTVERLPGVQVCNCFISGLSAAAKLGRPVFIIGGEEVYRKALPIASELHISWIEGVFRGNRRFPTFDLSDWSIHFEMSYPGFRYIYYQRCTDDRAAKR